MFSSFFVLLSFVACLSEEGEGKGKKKEGGGRKGREEGRRWFRAI